MFVKIKNTEELKTLGLQHVFVRNKKNIKTFIINMHHTPTFWIVQTHRIPNGRRHWTVYNETGAMHNCVPVEGRDRH